MKRCTMFDNMKRILTLLCLMVTNIHAQNISAVEEYINKYKYVAIIEMQRTGIPAAITLAQGIHESSAGTSELALKSNNHFGIKCKNTWTGGKYYHDDDQKGECFRAYPSAIDSYRDHSDFLCSSKRYSFLFKYEPTDYTSWAKGLKEAGYATNPKYTQLLINLIEEHDLNSITLMGLKKDNDSIIYEVKQGSSSYSIYNSAYKYDKPITDSNNFSTTVYRNLVWGNYPKYLFKINGCKVLFAEGGTALLPLAVKYKIALPDLLKWNDMNEKQELESNQLIFLQPKRKKGNNQFHIVQHGETLWQISQIEGIKLNNLLKYNQLQDQSTIPPGKTLLLQPSH